MIIANQVKPQITLEEFLTQPATKPAREYVNEKITEKPLRGCLKRVINSVLCLCESSEHQSNHTDVNKSL